jgi:hypothetical protein
MRPKVHCQIQCCGCPGEKRLRAWGIGPGAKRSRSWEAGKMGDRKVESSRLKAK